MDIRKKIDYSKPIDLRRYDPKYFTISKMEHPFYIKNNLPIWYSKIGKSKSLGTIYRTKNGSYIKASVLVEKSTKPDIRNYQSDIPCCDVFWEFEVYNAEIPKKYIIDTYHGILEKYYDGLKMIADNHLRVFPAVIEKKSEVKPPKIDANYRAEWASRFVSYLAEYAEKNPNGRIAKSYKETKQIIDKNKKSNENSNRKNVRNSKRQKS